MISKESQLNKCAGVTTLIQCGRIPTPLPESPPLQGPEVEYSFRAIPLGGYVGFPDDDPESPFPPDDPNLLRNKNIPARALVISAGIIANIIFAYAILLTQVRSRL